MHIEMRRDLISILLQLFFAIEYNWATRVVISTAKMKDGWENKEEENYFSGDKD